MIVKIWTKDEGWLFCNVEMSAKSRCLTEEQYKFGISEGTPHHTHVNLETLYSTDKKIFVKVINIDCGKIIIYTNQLAYLLNNEGKIIDKLN